MKNSLTHLPVVKQQELKAIVATTRVHLEVEMIILFGSYARGDWVEDAYEEEGVLYRYQSDYDLLVIVRTRSIQKQRRLESDLMNTIHKLSDIHTPFSVIVHDVHYINAQLDEGQYFFSDIKKEGVLLHSTGNLQLREIVKELNPQQRYELAKEDFKHWFTDAVGFHRTATSCIEKHDYNIAAFLLHQAAERSYNAILLVFTRYKPKTHNLEILRRLTHALDQRPFKIFPLSNPEEERLFKLLCDAYIDARYKKNYNITEQELLWLAERVKALQALTESLCMEKMQSFLAK